MNIVITCDQTDCVHNQNKEFNVHQLNSTYATYGTKPSFSISNLLLGTNICTYAGPDLIKTGFQGCREFKTICKSKKVNDMPNIPPSCAVCEEGIDSTLCINCCHKPKSKK